MTSFYIEQFGCRATQADGAAIERQLLEHGCRVADSRNAAEIVVVNTCTVTAAADAQARDAIRKIHAANPSARVIVTGCYAQRSPEDLAALPGVSWVVGNSHKPQIPELICAMPAETPAHNRRNFVPASNLSATRGLFSAGSSQAEREGNLGAAHVLVGDAMSQSHVLVAPVFGGEGHHTRPTLKIQDGCNSRCSFCVIPFVRGKSRSLPPDEVLGEINRLSAAGYREIVLSGINLGTWGRDLNPRIELIELLKRILEESRVERLRISSIEPMDVTRDLVDLFAENERLARHFHIPLQSGSDRILAAMHRWYRTEHYARRVEFVREKLPDAAIGADVIAGFPGETEEDHAATLSFIERLPFTYLHVFSYSSRPGTRAASLPNHVAASVIKRRARELRALGEAKSAVFRRTQAGQSLRVLTLHREVLNEDFTPAISTNYLQVLVPGAWSSNRWFDVVLSGKQEGGRLLAEVQGDPREISTASARHLHALI